MRKIVASLFLSLDGFMVGPNEDMSWVMDNFNDQMGRYAADLQASMDTVLLGRVTYEIMNKVWPFQTEIFLARGGPDECCHQDCFFKKPRPC